MKKLLSILIIPLFIIFFIEVFSCLGHTSPGMMGYTGGGGAVSAPGSFTISSVVAIDQGATLTWGTSSGATGYNGGCANASNAESYTATNITSPANITGLTNGTQYYCRVEAYNTGGNTISNNEVTVTPHPPDTFQFGTNTIGSQGSTFPNYLQCNQYTGTTANIDGVKIYGSASGNVKVAMYSDAANAPSTLLASQNTSTASTASQWNYIAFSVPYTTTSGTKYHLCINEDTTNTITSTSATGGTYTYVAATYSGYSFPSTAPAMSSSASVLSIGAWGH